MSIISKEGLNLIEAVILDRIQHLDDTIKNHKDINMKKIYQGDRDLIWETLCGIMEKLGK